MWEKSAAITHAHKHTKKQVYLHFSVLFWLTVAAGLEPVTAWPGAGFSVTTVTAQGDISTPAMSELINRSDNRWKIRLERTRLCEYVCVCERQFDIVTSNMCMNAKQTYGVAG